MFDNFDEMNVKLQWPLKVIQDYPDIRSKFNQDKQNRQK